jgi:tetratricopeptide (TPR) repeat protein
MIIIKHIITKLFVLIILFSPVIEAQSELTSRDKYLEAKKLIHEYSGKGDHYERANSLAREIFNNDANDPYSYLIEAELKSRIYKDYKKGSPEEILSLVSKVISLNDKISGAFVIRAKIANLVDDFETARENLNIAISLDATNKEAAYEFAILEQSENNFVEAEKYFFRTIELHTSKDRKSNIYYWLAKMYLKMTPKNIEKADQAMQKMVELSPAAPWKLVNYAIFLNTKTTNYDQAIKYSTLALEQMDFKMGHKTLGIALYANWAQAYKKNGYSILTRNTELKKLKEIESKTGITIDYAKSYAIKYMPASSIPQAFEVLGV